MLTKAALRLCTVPVPAALDVVFATTIAGACYAKT